MFVLDVLCCLVRFDHVLLSKFCSWLLCDSTCEQSDKSEVRSEQHCQIVRAEVVDTRQCRCMRSPKLLAHHCE